MHASGDGPRVLKVHERHSGERLDRWLAVSGQLGSRSQLQAAIREGRVDVDGRRARASLRLAGGETVTVAPGKPVDAEGLPTAEDLPLRILHEDECMLAVDKAAGMVVHPGAGNRQGTLVNALLHRYPDERWPGDRGRPGIVHRLDKETSGVVLVARTVEAHEQLSAQFRGRSVHKQYLALVRGVVSSPGVIDAALGRHPRDRKKMSQAARHSRPASTRYEPLESFDGLTLLKVMPETGRTHQIRVHMAASGWPVVRDPLYGGRSRGDQASLCLSARTRELLSAMPRQALHAAKISFAHPLTGSMLSIEAPLPDDFESLLRGLRGS